MLSKRKPSIISHSVNTIPWMIMFDSIAQHNAVHAECIPANTRYTTRIPVVHSVFASDDDDDDDFHTRNAFIHFLLIWRRCKPMCANASLYLNDVLMFWVIFHCSTTCRQWIPLIKSCTHNWVKNVTRYEASRSDVDGKSTQNNTPFELVYCVGNHIFHQSVPSQRHSHLNSQLDWMNGW